MLGYYKLPEETAATVTDGWVHTGDAAYLDEEGYLYLKDRIKDMVVSGGENIYPAEIEAFYFGHPQVAEVAVFGVPDERLGEEVGAWIKLQEGETVEVEALRDYARERIAHFKVPRHIWIVDEFPMTVTGKMQKFRMRELAVEQLARGSVVARS